MTTIDEIVCEFGIKGGVFAGSKQNYSASDWLRSRLLSLIGEVESSLEGLRKNVLMESSLSRIENDIKVVRESSYNSALDQALSLIRGMKS